MEHEDRYRQASQRSKYDCLLFDLDDTLYSLSSGLSTQCTKNIEEYMHKNLGIEESKVPEMCKVLYRKYGTTMAGLRAIGYEFDYDEYHSIVHGRLPYENLKPDPVLRSLLLSLPLRRLIFTNADKIHAAKTLSLLGLEDCFEGIICFETLNPPCKTLPNSDSIVLQENGATMDTVEHFSNSKPESELPETPILCKPSEQAFERALEIANINPHKTVFFDDSVRNIQSAKLVGFHTVLVGTSGRVKGADFVLENIHNIREAMPELWENEKKSGKKVRYSGKVAIETYVTA